MELARDPFYSHVTLGCYMMMKLLFTTASKEWKPITLAPFSRITKQQCNKTYSRTLRIIILFFDKSLIINCDYRGREDQGQQQENVPIIIKKNADHKSSFIPFVPQSGIAMPDGLSMPLGRFLLSFGTLTTTLTTTTTYISKITATCLSTTPFQLCGVTGK